MLLVNDTLQAEGVVQAYKQPCFVERAFRSYKPIDLEVRPIHRRLVCMLGYYVEWHMRKASAPILFDGDDPQGAKAQPSSIVAPAQRSASAQARPILNVQKKTCRYTAFRLCVERFGDNLQRPYQAQMCTVSLSSTRLPSPPPCKRRRSNCYI